ncbi:metallophosphoesterase family protein [Micromonosporaceae bacterium Da 78-11]
MFDTVAVISDVHGVLPVLQAVLDHPEARGADRIVVCGDHAAGPQPGEVLDLLAGLPHPVALDVRGFGPVVFCHGTPRDDEEVVLVDTRLEKWAEVFAELPDEVRTVVCGHTHMPYVRLVNRRTVVNPGSIGMPYGSTGGLWALLRDGEISLRRVEIDVDEAVAKLVAGSSYPDRQAWADCYLRSEVSDADAVTAFGPRDGRGA